MIEPKQILFYDNLFSMKQRVGMYDYVRQSRFTIGWKDSRRIELSQHQYLASCYSPEDMEVFGLLKYIEGTEAAERLSGLTYDRTMVNLSTPSDVNFVHVHENEVVMLYYVNLEWRPEWYGETIFYTDDCSSVAWTGAYTPGRVLIFDGELPHSIRPQSIIASNYRFTAACVFKKP